MEFVKPSLRGDFKLVGTYHLKKGKQLIQSSVVGTLVSFLFRNIYIYICISIDATFPLDNIPITVFGGLQSKLKKRKHYEGWSTTTTSKDFLVKMIPGRITSYQSIPSNLSTPHSLFIIIRRSLPNGTRICYYLRNYPRGFHSNTSKLSPQVILID